MSLHNTEKAQGRDSGPSWWWNIYKIALRNENICLHSRRSMTMEQCFDAKKVGYTSRRCRRSTLIFKQRILLQPWQVVHTLQPSTSVHSIMNKKRDKVHPLRSNIKSTYLLMLLDLGLANKYARFNEIFDGYHCLCATSKWHDATLTFLFKS